jgi:hypothetical protein
MLSLRPFVPSGPDFGVACQFFQDLGFGKEWESDGVAGFACGEAKFILQNYDVPEFAGNYMVRLDVSDLEAWWQQIEPLRLAEKYPGVRLTPPTNFPWGREVNIIDPAGVLWHIGQG